MFRRAIVLSVVVGLMTKSVYAQQKAAEQTTETSVTQEGNVSFDFRDADIQNVYNYKTTSSTFLVQDLDSNGNPIIENPGDPAELQRYRMKELESVAGTVLPTIGVIIEF